MKAIIIVESYHHMNTEKVAHAMANKLAFIFSTSGIGGKNKMYHDHIALRDLLISKGYRIADEFSCLGFNTNSFLKYFGGLNKNRPNAEDLKAATEFAKRLIQEVNSKEE